jgi:glycerophosphoryl diester phosphodiesterase
MIVMGHRGWSLAYPENTLAGFQAAIALEVDSIELDVHVSADDRVVVMHDADVKRTTGGTGKIREMTLDEIKRLDAGAWFGEEFRGAQVPTLEEVMDLAGGHAALAIEVKDPRETAATLNAAMVPLIRNYPHGVVVHSFDARYLRDFRREFPDVPAGYLCLASEGAVATAVEIGCPWIHASWQTVTEDLNRRMRDAGLSIMVWVARTEEDCREILDEMDVDAIGTDCPDVLIRLLKERGER